MIGFNCNRCLGFGGYTNLVLYYSINFRVGAWFTIMSRQAFLGSKTGKRKEFDRVFLDAVDDGLRRIFGETAGKTILLHLERNNGLKREAIPRNIEEFSSGLTELLGSGARVLEGLVIKLLCSKLQLDYDAKPNLRFAGHVQKLRERFEE